MNRLNHNRCICVYLIICKKSNSYLSFFTNSTSLYLNSYCSFKNPAFWLVYRFLDHNSKIRFFPDMQFSQKGRRPLALSYSSKKVHMNGFDFFQTQKPRFGSFEDFFAAPNPSRLFVKKLAPLLFLLYKYLASCKN